MAHTPGPWEARGRDVYAPCRIDGHRCMKGGNVRVASTGHVHADEADDDARLIAQAPEMYALLQEIVNDKGDVMVRPMWLHRVWGVIASVDGEGEVTDG